MVVDASNDPSRENPAVLNFFDTSVKSQSGTDAALD